MIYKMPFYKREPEEAKVTITNMPPYYIPKAIKKGLGLPPTKQPFITNDEYGAKCMLFGYDLAKRNIKRKSKSLRQN